MNKENYFELPGGACWIEQESIHVKVIESSGDPVEWTENQAELFANTLMKFVDKIKNNYREDPISK